MSGVGVMTICLNGEKHEVPEGVTLQGMVQTLELTKKSVVVELNRKVIAKSELPTTKLHENDTVEIVQFVGGG